MSSSQVTRQPLSLKFLLLLTCYFTLHILLRVTLSDSLDYDEAEQALLGQWLLAGYTEQPPLYSWIQYAFFQLFGHNAFSVSLLKNSLLLFTYIFVYFSSREILKDDRKAILATCSLLLIPQIGWESQRDMTHTTLVVCAASATLLQSLRLVRKQSLTNYALLGVCLAVGVLGKANFVLFIATLFLTLITFPEGRKLLFSPKMLLAIFILFLATGNYFYWMFNNQDIVFSATHKFKRAADNYQFAGVVSLFYKSLLFLSPMWILCLLVFPAILRGNDTFSDEPDFHQQFIKRYIFIFFAVLLLVILAFKVTYVKDRWLQPLLFAAPIFFFARLAADKLTARRYRIYLKITATCAVIIYLAFTVRVVGGSLTHHFCRMNYPFTVMAEDLQKNGFPGGLIISNNRFLAGNLRLKFPGSTALIPGYKFTSRTGPHNFTNGLVVWRADQSQVLPAELATYLTENFNILPDNYQLHTFQHIYQYGRTETVTMAAMIFPLSPRTENTP